jgi:hypothetical protein
MEDFRLTGTERQSHDLPMGWAIIASSGYLVLAAILRFSGAVKLRHPLAFAAAIGSYQILPRLLPETVVVASGERA